MKKEEKNKGGRPHKITQIELQKLETAFKMGCNNTEACGYAEIPESTFYDYTKKNPEFSDKIVIWKRHPILKAKNTIYKNLDDAKTAQWYLERKCKEEFSTQSKLELESKGINIVVADDEHKQMLEDL